MQISYTKQFSQYKSAILINVENRNISLLCGNATKVVGIFCVTNKEYTTTAVTLKKKMVR